MLTDIVNQWKVSVLISNKIDGQSVLLITPSVQAPVASDTAGEAAIKLILLGQIRFTCFNGKKTKIYFFFFFFQRSKKPIFYSFLMNMSISV